MRGNNKPAGGTKAESPTPVILCLVHRILWQRVSNLVNKLALLLHKCWFTQDSRNKSENDWCQGRGFSLVASKQRSVAYGNKVMDTRLPQPAGCGDKYDVSGWCFGHMLNAFCKFFNKYPSPDAKASPSPARGEGLHRPWCDKILGTGPSMTGGRGAGFVRLLRRCTPRNDAVTNGEGMHRPWGDKILGTDCAPRPSMTGARGANPLGRSMIEMLGVLAIIGVLSVGGIAGYSKAMEKWKVNQLISEYTHFMFGAIEHADDIRKVPNGSGYADIMQSLNAIPTSWTYDNASNVHDRLNNRIQLWRGGSDLVFEIYLLEEYEAKDSYSLTEQRIQLCRELFLNFVQPLSEFVDYSYVWRGGAQTLNPLWYGNKYCGADKICLKNVTIAEINAACHTCGDNARGTCSIVITY